jgi:hypothetical protein
MKKIIKITESDLTKLISKVIMESDPKVGTGKKSKDSDRRLYTDENPKDTVTVKFRTKQDIIDTLIERYNNPNYQDIWEASNFEITEIAEDNYLLTYLLVQNQTRYTRRSTIWRKVDSKWKILYHQGTVIAN